MIRNFVGQFVHFGKHNQFSWLAIAVSSDNRYHHYFSLMSNKVPIGMICLESGPSFNNIKNEVLPKIHVDKIQVYRIT